MSDCWNGYKARDDDKHYEDKTVNHNNFAELVGGTHIQTVEYMRGEAKRIKKRMASDVRQLNVLNVIEVVCLK